MRAKLGGRGSEVEKASVIHALKSLMRIPDWPTNLVVSGTPELHDLLTLGPATVPPLLHHPLSSGDLSPLIPKLVAVRAAPWQPRRPTTLEHYITEAGRRALQALDR